MYPLVRNAYGVKSSDMVGFVWGIAAARRRAAEFDAMVAIGAAIEKIVRALMRRPL